MEKLQTVMNFRDGRKMQVTLSFKQSQNWVRIDYSCPNTGVTFDWSAG